MHSQKYLKIWIIISMINTIVFMLNSGSLLSYIITGVIAGLSWVVAALHFINMVNYFEKEAIWSTTSKKKLNAKKELSIEFFFFYKLLTKQQINPYN